jgi:hypothetical protein
MPLPEVTAFNILKHINYQLFYVYVAFLYKNEIVILLYDIPFYLFIYLWYWVLNPGSCTSYARALYHLSQAPNPHVCILFER